MMKKIAQSNCLYVTNGSISCRWSGWRPHLNFCLIIPRPQSTASLLLREHTSVPYFQSLFDCEDRRDCMTGTLNVEPSMILAMHHESLHCTLHQ